MTQKDTCCNSFSPSVILYWFPAFLYLLCHPKPQGTNIYPTYRYYHTLLKVSPFIVAATGLGATTARPLLGLVILADITLDLEYLYPNRSFPSFQLGCLIYQVYHLANFIQQLQPLIHTGLLLPVILLSLFTCQKVTALLSLSLVTGLYSLTISLRLYQTWLLHQWPAFASILILGLGDCLLIYSKKHFVPFKDQLTMLSTYVHAWVGGACTLTA